MRKLIEKYVFNEIDKKDLESIANAIESKVLLPSVKISYIINGKKNYL